MEYPVEIFDQILEWFDQTGYNDHQLHYVMELDAAIDSVLLKQAWLLSLQAIPILATRYSRKKPLPVWESLPPDQVESAFIVTTQPVTFERETVFRIDQTIGPQVRLCVLSGQRNAITLTMNHMIADAAGFRDYLYLLCEIYAKLQTEPNYLPPATTGYRGISDITRNYGRWARFRLWLHQRHQSNNSGVWRFPYDSGDAAQPFIANRTIPQEKVSDLTQFCKQRGATINDAVLAAYYRVLPRYLNSAADTILEISIMIDMRRYLDRKDFGALRNLSSTINTSCSIPAGESFSDSVLRVKAIMDDHKKRQPGLALFCNLDSLFGMLGNNTASRLVGKHLKNPLLGMTNIGVLDASRLSFPETRATSAFMVGSIKYKPHFQLALSGFSGTITLSSNLYGNSQDRARIDEFLRDIETELTVTAT